MSAHVDFCGELYPISEAQPVTVGRDATIVIDDNPFLHRTFLEIAMTNDLVWISNVGSRLSATVADGDALMNAWLAPGARLPLVFERTRVWFTAGPTNYELDVVLPTSLFSSAPVAMNEVGETTIGRTQLTPDQRLLIVALAENVLRRGDRGAGTIPASNDAAQRLGWTITKFNRKLDNVCEKLGREGVRGLHVGNGKLATSRRARLVEYAVAARVVTPEDLRLLDL